MIPALHTPFPEMLYRVSHTSRYLYESPVSECTNELRLTPRRMAAQDVRETSLRVEPAPSFVDRWADYFGNEVTIFGLVEKHERLEVTAEALVDVQPRAEQLRARDGNDSAAWESVRSLLASPSDDSLLAAAEFVFDSPFVTTGPEFVEYAGATFSPGRPLLSAVRELTRRIHTEFQYKPRSTSIETPLAEIMRSRCGVCQDFSHVMIAALRSLRLAARYVSGYLRSGANYQGAEQSHAWVSVYVPEIGWVDFDPTNDVLPLDGHVTLGWGRDYSDVAPVKGITLGGGGETIEVEVRVQPQNGAAAPAGVKNPATETHE